MGGPRSLPCTPAQVGMWLSEQASPRPGGNIIELLFRIDGRLDTGRLGAAIRAVRGRHPSLCATIEVGPSGLTQHFQQAQPGPPIEAVADRRELCWTPVPINAGPLFQVKLCAEGDEGHLLWLGVHHLVCDAESIALLLAEIGSAYAGLPFAVDGDTCQAAYFEFCRAQSRSAREGQDSGRAEAAAAELAGAAPLVFCPPELGVAGAAETQFGEYAVPVPAAAFLAAARRFRLTTFMLLAAAWGVTFSVHADAAEFAVATSVNLRDLASAPAVGLLLNTVPVAFRVEPEQAVRQYLGQVRRRVLAALARSDLPLTELGRAMPEGGGRRISELCEVMVGLEVPGISLLLPGLTVRKLRPLRDSVGFALDLTSAPQTDALRIEATYLPGLLRATDVDTLVRTFSAVLVNLVDADPELPVGELPPRLLPPPQPSRWPLTSRERADPAGVASQGALIAAIGHALNRGGAAAPIGTLLPAGDLLGAAVGAVWLAGRTCAVLSPYDDPIRVAWLTDLLGLGTLLTTTEAAPLADGFAGSLVCLDELSLRSASAAPEPLLDAAVRLLRSGPAGEAALVVVAARTDEDVPVLFDAAACRELAARRDPADGAIPPEEAALMCHPSFAQLAAIASFAGRAPVSALRPRHAETAGWVPTGTQAWYHPATERIAVPEAGGIVRQGLAVLDRRGRAAGPGVVGELAVVAGPLAAGYPGQPARTAAAFVACAGSPGGRALRTGSYGLVSPDGTARLFNTPPRKR